MISNLPDPPYYAVIFLSHRREGDDGYAAMAGRMARLAAEQPGYLGMESLRDPAGWGVTISYWENREAIRRWKNQAEHLEAQARGRSDWYDRYVLRVCKVERAYGYP